MIHYDAGYLGVNPRLLLRLSGSVVPKALFWSVPAGGAAFGLFKYWESRGATDPNSQGTVSEVWAGYSFVLGFMIVFRMQQAYTRFWEAATLTNELRAEWIDAAQSLIAFSTDKEDKKDDVEKFQHYMVRLISLAHRAALERLNMDMNEEYPVINTKNIPNLGEMMDQVPDRCELVYQWVMRLTVKAMRTGVIDIPPPILGRSFQELSAGMVKLHNIMKICTIPMPFVYVQMNSMLLLLHSTMTPIISSLIMYNERWAGTLAFISCFCLWAIFYIAQEIEQPFGTHKNNLPCNEMQADINRILKMIMQPDCQSPPDYQFSDSQRVLTNLMGKTGALTERELKISRGIAVATV